MCGILVYIAKGPGRAPEPRRLHRALSLLSWRGPDYEYGTVWNNQVFLGQSILSLSGDISERSGTHLTSASGRFTLSFNGEIYNYRELAGKYLGKEISLETPDAEVLVNLFDVMEPAEVLEALDGMYAFVVLDKEKNQIIVGRDPQGEKSLFIHEGAEHIVVSSELRPILALEPSLAVDTTVLHDYFFTRHLMLGEKGLFRGVLQQRQGFLSFLDLKNLTWSHQEAASVYDWVDPSRIEKNTSRSIEDLTEELEEILNRAAKEMVPSGRSYASVVSGGIDSSLVTHFVEKHGHADCLVAVNHVGKDNISSDLVPFEESLQRKISVISVDAPQYAAEVLRCQKVLCSPLLAHSFVGQSIQSGFVSSQGCRVLFGGEGGDELFGGYGYYATLAAPGSAVPNMPTSPYMAVSRPRLPFKKGEPYSVHEEVARSWERALAAYKPVDKWDNQYLQATLLADFAHQVAAVGLRGADLMSMMWSVETRSLFIRKPVVQFALNLPAAFKVRPADNGSGYVTKPLLKRLFAKRFTEKLIFPKQGFAGFPNESARYLGDMRHFMALDVLDIDREHFDSDKLSRDDAWKLINTEFFLRERNWQT